MIVRVRVVLRRTVGDDVSMFGPRWSGLSMGYILVVLADCLAGAASLMAAETNAGVTVSISKVTSVCDPWSDGVVALLSVFPIVCRCVCQLFFSCLEILAQATPFDNLSGSHCQSSESLIVNSYVFDRPEAYNMF